MYEKAFFSDLKGGVIRNKPIRLVIKKCGFLTIAQKVEKSKNELWTFWAHIFEWFFKANLMQLILDLEYQASKSNLGKHQHIYRESLFDLKRYDYIVLFQ